MRSKAKREKPKRVAKEQKKASYRKQVKVLKYREKKLGNSNYLKET